MKKRILAFLLAAVMLLGLFLVPAGAEELTEDERLRQQIRTIYYRSLYSSGKKSLNGYCGMMTGLQLWKLGVTKGKESYDGNDFYDAYLNQEITSGGYKVKTYSGISHSMEEIFNIITCCGRRDVYNIVVCFQWTNTEAGDRFGHAVLVHAIVDGKVYFTEGFHSTIGGAAGRPIVCSIPEFCAYYEPWTSFEGMIVFGQKEYADFVTESLTDVFIQPTLAVELVSQPCAAGKNGCQVLRKAIVGERLRAVAVYEGENGPYYRVELGEKTAYIPGVYTSLLRINTEDITLQNLELDTALQEGDKLFVDGQAQVSGGELQELYLRLYKQDGTEFVACSIFEEGCSGEFVNFTPHLDVLDIPKGSYTLELGATVHKHYIENGEKQIQVVDQPVYRGEITCDQTPSTPVSAEETPEGWVFDGEAWQNFRNGEMRTGWFCDKGVDYYFDETGKPVTGWVTVNGKKRLFTETGAMCTGWVETEQGKLFLLSNGEPAVGKRVIAGKTYSFNKDGILQ